ncbi:MAG: glycosyltransferase family 4 protein [Bacteroidales bacterium]|nr:glycosyltransferase family 4 protein [Bacteroidales bacterium]
MQISIPKKDWLHTLRFSKIDLWISTLELLKEEVAQNTRFNAKKIKTIPLAVELPNVQMTKQEARAKLNLPQQAFMIGIVGRLDMLKGQHFLIECMAKLNAPLYNLHLLIVGEPTLNMGRDYETKLYQMVEGYKLGQHVHFKPFTKNLGEIYTALDVFAMASAKETFGMVTIEAMWHALPIIGTNTGGTIELLGNGEYGLLYQPDNHSEFIEKLLLLYQNPGIRQELTEKAGRHARAVFNKETIAKQLADCLANVITANKV